MVSALDSGTHYCSLDVASVSQVRKTYLDAVLMETKVNSGSVSFVFSFFSFSERFVMFLTVGLMPLLIDLDW